MTAQNLVFFRREHDRREDAKLGDLRAFVAHNIRRKFAADSARKQVDRRPIGGQIIYDAGTDTFRRAADSDDCAPFATPYRADRIAERKRFAEAEAEFSADCVAETGMGVSPEEFQRQQMDRAEIRRQSHLLAHMLETAGTVAYRDDAFQLWIWHVHSLHAEKIPNFRRICLLPYVAAIVRAGKLAALEYFLERNPFSRFWTFTSGERVGIAGLGERVSELSARLNTLNKELQRRFGVEIVFRSTELGTVEFDAAMKRQADPGSIEFDANGEPLFHVHAHTVVNSKVGFIPPKKWDEMVRFVWDHWGNHWDAGSIIRDAREACKYVTKPGDMLKLTPAQLARVEAQLHGKRLVTPLGTLKAEIRARKDAGKVLRRKRTREGMVWREAFDHNAHAAADEAEREAIWEMHQAEVIEQHDAHVADWDRVGNPVKRRPAPYCAVFARLAPAVGPRGLKEPRVIVGGTHFDRRTVTGHPLVSRLWAETVQQWEAGLRISVHTGTPTGERSDALPFMAELPERCAPPSPPVFAIN